MILKTNKEINTVINSEFSVIIAKSKGCGVCEITKAQLTPILKEYNLVLHEVYIEDVPEFRGSHLVFTVPTVLLFSKEKELHRESRFIDLNKIMRIIKLNLK